MTRIFILLFVALFLSSCGKSKKENSAYKFHEKGEYESAIIIWEELLEVDSENAKYLNNLGWAYMQNDNLEKIEEYFVLANNKAENKNLLKSIETNRKLLNSIKDIPKLFEQNEFEKCLEIIEKLDNKTSVDDFIKSYEAKCLFEIGELEKSEKLFNEIIDKYKKKQSQNKYSIEAKKMLDIIIEIRQ